MISRVLVFVAICLVVFSLECTGCPPGWSIYGGHCYGLVREPMDWAGAQSTCVALGGYLAEIFDEGEERFVRNMASENTKDRIWLGGQDLFQEGNWAWSNSATRITKYFDWHAGEPNNVLHPGLGGENCLAIILRQGERTENWYDDACSVKHPFVCKRALGH